MVTTVGIPREWRLGGKPEEPAELSASQQEESQEARQHDDDDDTDNDDDVFGEIPKDPEDEEVLDPVVHLINPEGVCVGPDGSIYVTDSIHSCVRKISAAGRVTNMAGDGKRGQRDGRAQVAHFSDADKALPAQFCHPRGILVDDAGNLFVCDTENHTVRGTLPEPFTREGETVYVCAVLFNGVGDACAGRGLERLIIIIILNFNHQALWNVYDQLTHVDLHTHSLSHTRLYGQAFRRRGRFRRWRGAAERLASKMGRRWRVLHFANRGHAVGAC